MDDDEIDADWPRLSERFEGAGHVVATQAGWWQGKALAAGRTIHASLYGRAAAGAENPGEGRYSDEVAVVTGASKGSIAASVVAPAARRRCDRHRHHVQARRRPAGVLPQACIAITPGSARTLWVVPANMASYTDIDALVSVGRHRADRKPWAAVDSRQGRAEPDAAVPVRGAARHRRPVRGRLPVRDGDEGAAVGRAAAHRRAVGDRRRPRHRVPAARRAARLAQPRHVRRRRRVRRSQVGVGRGGVAVEGRVVVGAAGVRWPTR